MRLLYPIHLAFFGLLLASPAAAQWSTQSPIPTRLDVRGVAAPTPQRVFIATADDSFDDGGALFESQDGGGTWVQRDVPASLGNGLNGVFFLDDQRGWAFGNENVRTTDGGTTWEALPFLGSTYFMAFHTPDFGHALTNGGTWLSRDGGLTWEAAPDGLFTFDFADAALGLGASPGGLYRTTDGGATFALVHAGAAEAVAFLSPTVAVAIVDGAFARSEDGGQTWTPGAPAGDRNRLHAVSGSALLAWRYAGAFNPDGGLLRSADGGQTWTDLGDVIGGGTSALTSVGAQAVVALGSAGDLYHSADAGQTWTRTFASVGPAPSAFGTVAPVFADGQTGYVAFGGGFVLKTTDGGQTWQQISSGYGASLNDVGRFADGRLIAVGEAGTVLTSDGAGRWTLQPSPVNAGFSTALSAVQVLGPQESVAVDEGGRLFRSSDGGRTWTAGAATPVAYDARDLHFSTLLDGWVVGSGPGQTSILRTTDGGDSWTPVPGIGGTLVAVDFEGEAGWAAYPGDRLLRTTDGGLTWTLVEMEDPPDFLDVADMDFWDASVGYAVGSRGYAARSNDGGLSWTVLPTPSDEHDLTDLYLVGPAELWASTRSGVALYSATGGQNWAVMEVGTGPFSAYAAITASPGGDAWTVGFGGAIEHFAGPPPPPENHPPQASFTFETDRLTVTFTDTSTDPDGTVTAWLWNFDDGTTSTEQNPTHTFPAAGTYVVRLTVTDDDGATGTGGAVVIVQPGPGGTFGGFTEVTPNEPYFVTPQDEDFWVATTAAADYDGDGDLDVAVLGYYVVYFESVEEKLLLFRNDGEAGPDAWAFEYVEVPLGDLSTGASDMAWGDYDGDGDLDLAVGTDGATALYRNDGGTLVPTDAALPGYYEDNFQADFDLRSITWADVDNDGDPDLLIPSVLDFDTFEYRTALMRNDGPDGSDGWAFTEIDAGIAPTAHAQSAWADMDGDGDLDLLLVNAAPLTDEGFVRIYRNDGDGTFTAEDVLGGLTIEHGEAQWGDYDFDGDLDILVAGHVREAEGGFDRILRLYTNDGDTYTASEVIACIGCDGWFDITAATWADYDSDGDVDILMTGTHNPGTGQIEGRARVFINEGGTFVDTEADLPAPRAGGTRGGTFSWLDLDGDGDLDYFIAGDYWVPGGNGLIESQIHAYRNDALAQNAAPTPPSNLVATVSEPRQGGGRTVTLSWDPASDDSTPAGALTYDLELRRDGEPVATPRRLPEPGSVSAVTGWVLSDLPDGAYTWTVRAVDSAFNGSAPAEGTFTVGTVAAEDGALPGAYALGQPYPNPFAASVSLTLAVARTQRVTVGVYDALGRRVALLHDGELAAGAEHRLSLEGGGLAAGVYLLRATGETFTASRRVVLVR